jgi:hypothetical protein
MPNSTDGSLIEQGTPLTLNHWFDGKFLRADDLARDQDYHRAALRLANQASGFGVVRGLEVGLAAAELVLQPGLGLCANGELLLLESELRVGVEALIAASNSDALSSTAAPPALAAGSAAFAPCVAVVGADAAVPASGGLQIYRLTLSPHQALCGYEDVVGALCERACVSERQRPYKLDGVRLRARRLALNLPELRGFTISSLHLRSRIASALFALDDAQTPPLPDNGGRLQSPLWCSGTEFSMDGELLLGILVRGGSLAAFIDLWAGRRERMTSQAEAYWRRRTRMRPLADFIAQVAQFQCQFTAAFRDGLPPPGGGECDALRALVAGLQQQLEAAAQDGQPVDAVPEREGLAIDWNQAASPKVMQRIGQFVQAARPLLQGRADRLLLDRGIVELPPAGFLPVVPGSNSPLAQQLQDWVGPGVRLQICSAPLDAIGHLFEEAQHSARTSLTSGLADPADTPLLQIIVPDGEGSAAPAPPASAPGFALTLHVVPALMLSTLVRLLGQTPVALAPGMVAVPAGPSVGAASGPASGPTSGTPTSTAAPAPALSTGAGLGELAGLGDLDEAESMAEGAGRVPEGTSGSALGTALRFALAAQGRPVGVDRAAALHEFEACWSELECSANPFSAAPGARIELLGLLSEADRPGAELPSSARVGLRLRLQAQLQLDPDGAREQATRAEIEPFTGLQGGTVRMGTLSGSLQTLRQSQGVPDRVDGQVIEREDRFALPLVFLQQLAQPAGLHTVIGMPVNLRSGNLVVVLLECLPAQAGQANLRLRLLQPLPQEAPPLTHVAPPAPQRFEERRFPLVSLRADAQALSVNSTPRRQAEAGLAALDTVLGPNAPDAAARERLLGLAAPAATAASLSARHDWVLFRRPVDARCSFNPAPVPTPPAPAPEERIKAWVLRLQGLSGRVSVEQAIEILQAGRLPNSKVATLGDAGELRFAAGSSSPVQSDAQLQASFSAAGFSPVPRAVVLHGNTGATAAEREARYAGLGSRLGAGSSPLPLAVVSGSLAAALPPGAAQGSVIVLVEPLDIPPPPPGRITRQHRLLLLTNHAREANNLQFEFLRDTTALSSAVNEQLLALQTAGQLPLLQLNFGWPANPGGTLEAFDNELREVGDAVMQAGGFTAPPRVLTIAQVNADAEAMRRSEEEARFIANKFNSIAGVPEAAVRKAVVTLSTFSGNSLMQAVTLLFVRG